MSFDRPSYGSDPEAWDAYLAEGNATQARKRVSVDALLRDQQGRILLVDPNYKPNWDMPGGMVEANEPLPDALQRELREELGLKVQVGELLCVDWVAPYGPWDDLLNFIFDGGILDPAEMLNLRLRDDELSAYEFCDESQAERRLQPRLWNRLTVALEALATGRTRYLQNGYPH
jgi:8-oxo-dGTP diphosphatase